MEDYDPDPDVRQSLPKYSLSAGRVCNDAHTDVPTSDGSYSEVNTACEKTCGMIDMHDKALAHEREHEDGASRVHSQQILLPS